MPAKTEPVAAVPMSKVRPAEPVTPAAEVEPEPEPEPVETGLTIADDVEVPSEGRGRNWTVISVVAGIFAAAAGIAVLKIAKVI